MILQLEELIMQNRFEKIYCNASVPKITKIGRLMSRVISEDSGPFLLRQHVYTQIHT